MAFPTYKVLDTTENPWFTGFWYSFYLKLRYHVSKWGMFANDKEKETTSRINCSQSYNSKIALTDYISTVDSNKKSLFVCILYNN